MHMHMHMQASLAVFLRAHAEALAISPDLAPAVRALRTAQSGSWGELRAVLHSNLCLTASAEGEQLADCGEIGELAQ